MNRLLRRFITLVDVGALGIGTWEALNGYPWVLALLGAPSLICIAMICFVPGLRPSPPVPVKPPVPAGEIREARYPDGAPEGTCPVCGQDDPERWALGIGVRQHNGQPAHGTCTEWLERGPRVTRYTGPLPEGSGTPCSDCCHAMMRLPDGAEHLTANWVCSACGERGGFHNAGQHCDKPERPAGTTLQAGVTYSPCRFCRALTPGDICQDCQGKSRAERLHAMAAAIRGGNEWRRHPRCALPPAGRAGDHPVAADHPHAG